MELGKIFRLYIWGANGIDYTLKKLNNKKYGNDLKLVLFQFYIKPIKTDLGKILKIE
ncbi:MAG: hypothetical protein LBR65_01425 [Culturomica sp.]|jgi:hypothetical protein|nr:hypothetical protein [Culturomica sp.]